MFTARGDETDRIVGLEMGADDYLPKTFSSRELLARLRAVIRRSKLSGDEAVEGAEESLKLAILSGAKKAILKRRSPSCGLSTPYCETNSGYGPGVTAALFTRHDIEIIEAG
jgi:uncharacterized protein YbbK (DUF523 family)